MGHHKEDPVTVASSEYFTLRISSDINTFRITRWLFLAPILILCKRVQPGEPLVYYLQLPRLRYTLISLSTHPLRWRRPSCSGTERIYPFVCLPNADRGLLGDCLYQSLPLYATMLWKSVSNSEAISSQISTQHHQLCTHPYSCYYLHTICMPCCHTLALQSYDSVYLHLIPPSTVSVICSFFHIVSSLLLPFSPPHFHRSPPSQLPPPLPKNNPAPMSPG